MLTAKLVLLTFIVSLVNAQFSHGGRFIRSHRSLRKRASTRLCPNRSHPPSLSISSSSSSSSLATLTSTSSSAAATSTSSTEKVSSSSTSTSSSVKSTPTGKAPNLLNALFPVDDTLKSWTTAQTADDALPLSDSTFQPEKVLKALRHDYVQAPDGKEAMKAHYPEGSYNFQHDPMGGFSFYAPGPDSVDLTTAQEATFGYSVYFEDDFDFQLGGKLPGLYGGDDDEVSTNCSGGRRDTRCFSARLMWREDGKGEFYTYLPPYTEDGFEANKKQCNIEPESECNPEYGASVGRGSFKFARGAWTTISERVRLNDAGKANGQIELFVNGKSVINVDGLIIRDSSAGRIRGLQMQTFFGGSHPEFASPKTQNAYFADFSVAITKKL